MVNKGGHFTLKEARQFKANLAKSSGFPFDDFDWSEEANKAFQKWLNTSLIDILNGRE